jgi:hypothetical protein
MLKSLAESFADLRQGQYMGQLVHYSLSIAQARVIREGLHINEVDAKELPQRC